MERPVQLDLLWGWTRHRHVRRQINTRSQHSLGLLTIHHCSYSPSPAWPCRLTCCSIKRRVSSETPSLDFFSVPMAPDRTFLNDSLALWLNSLASLHRFSLCSRVTLRRGICLWMQDLLAQVSYSAFRENNSKFIQTADLKLGCECRTQGATVTCPITLPQSS